MSHTPAGYQAKSLEASCCASCAFFSIKAMYLDDGPNSGNCYVDATATDVVWWVSSAGWCPRFAKEQSA